MKTITQLYESKLNEAKDAIDLPKSFKNTTNTRYKNLKPGATIKIKKLDGGDVIFTVNSGAIEYRVEKSYIDYLYLLSKNTYTMDTLFINPDKSDSIGMHGVKRHVGNMTKLGKELYDTHDDAEEFIRLITHD